MKVNSFNLGKEWLDKKKALAELQAEFDELDSKLKEFMFSTGLKTVEVDKSVIELQVNARRSFDAIALKDMVSASVFNKITKPTVDTTLIDAAVKLGTIKPDVVEQVTKKTEYKQLRVK
jgi:hypothetical protein